MKKFLINLINLHSRNNAHVRNLDKFIDSERFGRLDAAERNLIAKQAAAMHQLDAIFAERLRLHGIEV